MTNTRRTATEQLLVSNAIDQAIDQFDFDILKGKTVYLDSRLVSGDDKNYLIGTLRQKIATSGCHIEDNRKDAEVIVEARTGTVGTDTTSLVFGVPSVDVPPALLALSGAGTSIPSIPEVPLIKNSKQKGVIKLALFAYEHKTGQALWQSGSKPVESTSSETWVFGAGPFQRGTIHQGTKFAGASLPAPALHILGDNRDGKAGDLSVNTPAVFMGGVIIRKTDVAKKEDLLPSPEEGSTSPDEPAVRQAYNFDQPPLSIQQNPLSQPSGKINFLLR
ncbi:MAG: hypothetical protein MPJ24_09350 [Pirellulaceae bacterium]|nr:hypothetical protein [Pirellulaceae bacterium]